MIANSPEFVRNRLPNFSILGVAKSGTTSLHAYLNRHSTIYMAIYMAKLQEA